jgi:hypothetical protein
MSKEKPTVLATTTTFLVPADTVKSSIYERVKKYSKERDECLANLAELIHTQAGKDDQEPDAKGVAAEAALMMMAMAQPSRQTGNLKVVLALRDRAAYLTQEMLELSSIAKNLLNNVGYEISLEDSIRYGIGFQ